GPQSLAAYQVVAIGAPGLRVEFVRRGHAADYHELGHLRLAEQQANGRLPLAIENQWQGRFPAQLAKRIERSGPVAGRPKLNGAHAGPVAGFGGGMAATGGLVVGAGHLRLEFQRAENVVEALAG